jgi:hypothetical protein
MSGTGSTVPTYPDSELFTDLIGSAPSRPFPLSLGEGNSFHPPILLGFPRHE